MMDWYWIVLIIAGFAGLVGAFIYLGKTGKLSKQNFGIISTMVIGLSDLMERVADATSNNAIDVVSTVAIFVKQAVLAAQNSWYNDEIYAEDRYAACKLNLQNMLEAANIELDDTQKGIVNLLIKAACEELGHGAVAAKEAAEAVVEE